MVYIERDKNGVCKAHRGVGKNYYDRKGRIIH